MNKPVTILEKALLYWEDRHFMLDAARAISKGSGKDVLRGDGGPIVAHTEFRNYLLNAVSHESSWEEQEQKFGMWSFRDAVNNSDEVYFSGLLAYGLYSWVKESRRVFKLEQDLQLLLDATSLEGVTLGDVQFPFNSFLVEVEKPFIEDSSRNFSHVLVVAEEHEGKKVINFLLLSNDALNYQPFPPTEKAEVTRLLRKRNWDRAQRLTCKMQDQTTSVPGAFFTSHGLSEDELITNAFKHIEGAVNPPHFFIAALRTVLGMCLYLKSLPSRSPLVSEWEHSGKVPTPRGKAISEDAQVCSVASSFKLSFEERESFSDPAGLPTRSFGEKCCHFRRGTWCRPSGSTLDAPRTLWRRPTIVRKDKLKPGELPKGAENMLTLK